MKTIGVHGDKLMLLVHSYHNERNQMRERLKAKMNVAFTERTADAIRKIAAQEQVSSADVIRECVKNDLPKLRERLRKQKARQKK